MKLRIMSLFCIIATLCLMWGCTNNNEENKEYTVIYNLMGGTYEDSLEYPKEVVKHGETVDSITPVREGYIFKGWSNRLNDTMSGNYDFSQGITTNTVLYAVWHRPQIKYELNGGYFALYNTVDELINAFCQDFSTWRGWGNYIRPQDFVDYTWDGSRFFGEGNYQIKWDGLLSFLASVETNSAKNYFKDFINSDRTRYCEKNENEFRYIRYEIQAFLCKTQIVNTSWPVLTTADYSDPEIMKNIWKYFTTDSTNFFDNSNDYNLATPRKDGYEFGGWYSNPEFSGEAISFIPKGTEENQTFYAKWHK